MTDLPASPTAHGFRHLDQGRSVHIETPEHVRIGFELAGVGSRAAAVVADVLVLAVTLFVLGLGYAGLRALEVAPVLQGVGRAALIFAGFLSFWGYFFLSEGLFNGRTLGKRWVGVRVIGQGGTPITLQAAALRNLLRIIDLQPAFTGMLGLAFIGLHPRGQRLGDMVAGTVVVRDRGADEAPERLAARSTGMRPQLDPARFDVLARFVARKDTLPAPVRSRLVGRVAEAMGPILDQHPQRLSRPLEELLVELHQEEELRQGGGAAAGAQAVHLVRTQSGVWDEYGALVKRAEKRGLSSLSDTDLTRFTELYREVTSDLARAHTYGASIRLRFELERLAGEGHNLLYRGSGAPSVSLLRWLRQDFPRTFRAQWAFVSISAVLLFGPSLVGYAAVRADPELARQLLPSHMISRAEEAADRLARGDPYVDVPPVQMSVMSSALMTNNLQVSFIATAGGILAGLGSIWILIFNGVHLGSVMALYDLHEAGALIWTFILPHGVLELTAIVISGAAGLVLAEALIRPGRRTRTDSLRHAGRTVLSLVGGTGVLLVLAGLVEGFISPARIDPGLKVGFATVVATLLWAYLLTAGRGRKGATEGPDASLPRTSPV
ncbi:MAG: stage II sporulation protein M [Gemmatimonadota bacterium]|nr:stage II sporulation protein M [Gemmatimonadota bacterium]MDH5760674.1 stage II sporulation protein M [Gemmatimonadota bacterium]